MLIETLKDRHGRILGRIYKVNEHKYVIKDRAGRILGYYNTRDDRTYASNGRMIGKGNLLTLLLNLLD